MEEVVKAQPTMLQGPGNAKLREYQLVGLQWMVSLYNNRLNGILADEMGLGKTVQVCFAAILWVMGSSYSPLSTMINETSIRHAASALLLGASLDATSDGRSCVQVMALLAYLMENKGVFGPHLIIVPNAVIVNWKSELSQWLPDVRCVYYVGSKDERARMYSSEVQSLQFNVLVTTYEYIMRDRAKLSKVRLAHESHPAFNAFVSARARGRGCCCSNERGLAVERQHQWRRWSGSTSSSTRHSA